MCRPPIKKNDIREVWSRIYLSGRLFVAILQAVVKGLTKPAPKVISPNVHGVLDYVIAATFIVGGIFMMRRNKRAGISALACAAAETVTSLLTDYPAWIAELVTFPTHGKIDMGLAAMTATLPGFMDFEDEREKTFFTAEAVLMTVLAGLTDFGDGRGYQRAFEQEAA